MALLLKIVLKTVGKAFGRFHRKGNCPYSRLLVSVSAEVILGFNGGSSVGFSVYLLTK